MSEHQEPKWYFIDMFASPRPPREDGWGHTERDDLPAYKLIYQHIDEKQKPIGTVNGEVGGRYEGGYSIKEYRDYRRAHVRTTRHKDIEEIGKLQDVTITEMQSSGFYYISGIYFDEDEKGELNRLHSGPDADAAEQYRDTLKKKFKTVVWPHLKPAILETIKQYDPEAVLYNVEDNRLTFIKTHSTALIHALWKLDRHVFMEEFVPGTTLEDVTRMYEREMQAGKRVPTLPQTPPAGLKFQEFNGQI